MYVNVLSDTQIALETADSRLVVDTKADPPSDVPAGEYDGTVFICCSPRDRERIDAFRQAFPVRDGREVCAAIAPEKLAETSAKNVLFVSRSMQDYLGRYLEACPAGARHLLIYSRRFGNGPSPFMSSFLDFWMERDVKILELAQ